MGKEKRLLDEYRFPGYRPRAKIRGIFGDPKARVIRLERTRRTTECGICGTRHRSYYDRKTRGIRDLSCGDARIYLETEIRRVKCRKCGTVKREKIDWLAKNPFYTKRFSYFVGRKCRGMTIQDVAKELRLDWHTVKNLEKEYMEEQLRRNPVRESADYSSLRAAVNDICRELAVKIATDGEGATKFIRIDVAGLKDDLSAEKAAKAVANSPLCKTAFFGQSPNWGRIVSAIGAAGIEFRLEEFSLKLNGEEWILSGEVSASAEARVRSELKKGSIDLSIRLGAGPGAAEVFTCDLSPDYVKINAGYRS